MPSLMNDDAAGSEGHASAMNIEVLSSASIQTIMRRLCGAIIPNEDQVREDEEQFGGLRAAADTEVGVARHREKKHTQCTSIKTPLAWAIPRRTQDRNLSIGELRCKLEERQMNWSMSRTDRTRKCELPGDGVQPESR